MIRPFPGVAFGDAADGDGRREPAVREWQSAELGIPSNWAFARQIHGSTVVVVTDPGHQGEADALLTDREGLPVAVSTADCVPVALLGDRAAGVVHAGWRGACAGVLASALQVAAAEGWELSRAAIGPAIGPCCFEVGPEVVALFPSRYSATTKWGTTSVDLVGFLRDQLDGMEVWVSGSCTRCDDTYHSHRRDATPQRQVAVAWLPPS